jgi:hypothetical protein
MRVSPTTSFSCGVHHWFKRRCTKKNFVIKENEKIVIIIIIIIIILLSF